MKTLIFEGGKYRFWSPDPPHDHELYCDRNGKAWREFVGDHAVKTLFDFAVQARREVISKINNPDYRIFNSKATFNP